MNRSQCLGCIASVEENIQLVMANSMENIGRNRNTAVKLASQNRNAVTACSPLVPGKLFSNFLMKVHTEVYSGIY